VQGSARAESREFDGKYFKQVEAEQFQVQDSQKETAEKVTAVVVGEVFGRDSGQELEPGFKQESARTGCKEVVGKTFFQGQVSGPPAAAAKGKGKGLGKVFKQVKEEQFWGQDMQEEDAMVCSEVAVGKLVGKIVGEYVGEAKVPDSVQGSARAESREFDGKYFKQVEAEQFQVQDSQKETAEKVTAVVVGEVFGRDSEQELEPGFTQESARTGCNEVVGKTFVQGQVSEAMVKCTEVAVGELVGRLVGVYVEEAMVPDSVQGPARAEGREFDGKFFKQVKAEQFQGQDSLKETAVEVTAALSPRELARRAAWASWKAERAAIAAAELEKEVEEAREREAIVLLELELAAAEAADAAPVARRRGRRRG